jgi:hypothetical protein
LAPEPITAVLDELAAGPRPQKDLLDKFFDGKSGKASDALKVVERLGLIARPGGRTRPYVLVHPEETKKLLVAAAELAHAVSRAQAESDAELLRRRRSSNG